MPIYSLIKRRNDGSQVVRGDQPNRFAHADRKLTINGVTYDLSADRSWTVSSYTSPLTTKGDILGHSTVDDRIPVGTDGQVLTADSAQALGVKWASAPVASVSNSDGTLTISPTTGAVVASLNLGNANTWTTQQNFTSSVAPQVRASGYSDVGGANAANGSIRLGTNATYFGRIDYDQTLNTTLYIDNAYSNNNAAINFRIGGTTVLGALGSGAVGIGTAASTSQSLVVSSNGGAVPQGLFYGYSDARGTANATDGQVNLGSTAAYRTRLQNYNGTAVQTFLDQTWNDATAEIRLRTRTAGTPVNNLVLVGSGKAGINTAAPSAFLHVTGTTEQLRVAYDASNYYTTTVGSTGGVDFKATGSGKVFGFKETNVSVYDNSAGNTFPTLSVLHSTTGAGNGASRINLGTVASPTHGTIVYDSGNGKLTFTLNGSGNPSFTFVGAASVQNTQFGWGYTGALASTDTIKLGQPSNGSFKYINLESGAFGVWNQKLGWTVSSSGSNAAGTITLSNVVANTNDVSVLKVQENKFGFGNSVTPSALIHGILTSEQLRLGYDASNYYSTTVGSTGGVTFDAVGSGASFTFSDDIILADAKNVQANATTGSKIGTATTQKLGFWNATPIVQPTTAVAAATFVANTSAIADDSATFDGYTLGQVVKALRNAGLLA